MGAEGREAANGKEVNGKTGDKEAAANDKVTGIRDLLVTRKGTHK